MSEVIEIICLKNLFDYCTDNQLYNFIYLLIKINTDDNKKQIKIFIYSVDWGKKRQFIQIHGV